MIQFKKYIPHRIILMRRKLIPVYRKMTGQNMQAKTEIPILHLHLTDHCNLNCKGCDNFSPLATEVYTDINQFEKDCAQIAKIAEGKVCEIQLLGGEPLLHPELIKFMEITRRYFPTNAINIVSNGILLKKQPDEFWISCRQNKISIVVTKYPIKLDFEGIKQLADSKGVNFSFYGNTETVEKNMECIPLDLEGKQDAKDSFLRCSRANRCIALDNGKIYPCSLIPYVKYFNLEFKQNLQVTPQDYIDVDKLGNLGELLQFVSQPVPFCKYCNIKGTVWDIGYGISKKDILEWTVKSSTK